MWVSHNRFIFDEILRSIVSTTLANLIVYWAGVDHLEQFIAIPRDRWRAHSRAQYPIWRAPTDIWFARGDEYRTPYLCSDCSMKIQDLERTLHNSVMNVTMSRDVTSIFQCLYKCCPEIANSGKALTSSYNVTSYLSTSPLPWRVRHSPIVSSPWDSAFGCFVTGNLPEPLQIGQVVFMICHIHQYSHYHLCLAPELLRYTSSFVLLHM
jgi:hypothetical protein